VAVNGRTVGTRTWRPYRFDVTGTLRPGENALRVTVANTHAQARAALPGAQLFGKPVSGPSLLERLERNGLLGPVQLRVAAGYARPMGTRP
jgi:hypothetical protein